MGQNQLLVSIAADTHVGGASLGGGELGQDVAMERHAATDQ